MGALAEDDQKEAREGTQAQRQGQSEREDTPLLPLHATPCDTDVLNQRNGFHRDVGATTSAGDSENPDALRSLKIEGSNVTSLACDSNSLSSSESDIQTDINPKLLDAVLKRDLDSVRRLLADGATPSYVHNGSTILHKCILNYGQSYLQIEEDKKTREDEMEIIKELLKIASKTNTLDIINVSNQTPLFYAIDCGDLEIIKALVDAGARLKNIGDNGETAMHVALIRGFNRNEVLRYFLDNHSNIQYSPDNSRSTPIHYLARSGNVEMMKLFLKRDNTVMKLKKNKNENVNDKSQIIPVHEQCTETVQDLINSLNDAGDTPVHLSARQGHVDMTRFLLHNGGALSVTGERNSVIKDILVNFDHPYEFLENILDDNVFYKGSYIPVCYNVLGGLNGGNQIKCVDELVKYGFNKLLKHPLIESLIYIKWECIRPVFRTILRSYGLFLVLFNIFIITAFFKIDAAKNALRSCTCPDSVDNNTLCSCPDNNDTTSVPKLDASCIGGWYYGWYPFIYILIVLLIAQESMWIYLQRRRYLKRVESYVTWAAILLACAVPLALGCAPAPWPAAWQRHVACAALLLVWLRPLFLLSRFSGWGHYVLMFQTVAINISKIFVMFICLVIGFALCFMIQYQLEPPFDNPGVAIIKTLVMLSSEFEYEDLFGEKHAAQIDTNIATSVIVRLLFVVFVIFMATVLMNLMIGVAVSDINELTSVGAIKALEMQVEFLNSLDGAENTFLTKVFGKLSHLRYHYYIMSYSPSASVKWKVNSKGSSYEVELPLALHNAILKNAKQKIQFEYLEKNNMCEDLEERMVSIEDNIKKIIQSDEQSRHCIDDLKKDVQKMLNIVSMVTSNVKIAHKSKVVSTKSVSRKRKRTQK